MAGQQKKIYLCAHPIGCIIKRDSHLILFTETINANLQILKLQSLASNIVYIISIVSADKSGVWIYSISLDIHLSILHET